ncbi:MAG: TRAP transporter substrate-binding protein [Pyramidobacter sp.]|nr:TRAP transporter substrate-binding protein [Pyramidobacter sp.]
MKKTLALILCLAIVAGCLAGCGGNSSAPAAVENPGEATSEEAAVTFETMDPVVIRFGHGLGEGEVGLWIVENWMAQVEEKSAGKITFEYYPGGQLGTLVEHIEQLELGSIDAIFTETSLWESYVPEVGMISAPFIIDSYDHCAAVIYGEAGALVEKSMQERTHSMILGWAFNGARVMACTEDFDSLDNCGGIIMRSPESQVYIDTFELMGMNPTPLAFSEVYTAIQTGVVQGYECPAQSIYATGTYSIAPYIVKTRHMYSYNTLDINQKFWNSLPECAQVLLKETWDELKGEMNQIVMDDENNKYDLMAADGATINEFVRTDAFNEKCAAYWAEKAASIGGYAEDVYAAIEVARP